MLLAPSKIGLKLLKMEESDIRYLYELVDPRDNLPKYIGITKNPQKRYYNHILTELNRKTPKSAWVKKLKKLNLLPIMKIITIVHKDDINKLEIETISEYRQKYKGLKNLADGGNYGSKSQLLKSRKKKVFGKNIKTGEYINFECAAESKKLGFSPTLIRGNVNNKTLSACGYIWANSIDEVEEKYLKYKTKQDPRSVAVIGISDSGEKIIFNSLAEATKAGFTHSNIIRSIKTGIRCKKYYWSYLK